MWDPRAIADLQKAAREGDEKSYWRFSDYVNNDARVRCSLRSLMKFREGINGGPIPLDEVEPASEIVKRFSTGAMRSPTGASPIMSTTMHAFAARCEV